MQQELNPDTQIRRTEFDSPSESSGCSILHLARAISDRQNKIAVKGLVRIMDPNARWTSVSAFADDGTEAIFSQPGLDEV